MTKIAVLGAGAFGTALAITLARTGQPVLLWARNEAHADALNTSRENALRLPGAPLPSSIEVTSLMSRLGGTETILLAVPMQAIARFLTEHHDHIDDQPIVACCKGVDLATGLGPTATISKARPNNSAAILTGPSFAIDIANGLPTALTLACAQDDIAKSLQTQLSTETLRLYRTTDAIGAELGGALKNVVAIACGVTIGAGLGESARAAVMTRGYAEIQRLAGKLGARPETLAGLSGFGDLTLTCTSEKSRNFSFGLSLGRGGQFDPTKTVEGAATAQAVAQLAQRHDIDMPITSVVAAVLTDKISITDAMTALLSRPLKEE
ncbi:MAG: NAD(P)H-dependent glycerol-3-phosphate dehydrogenase [Pseudoruegeria sp.]